MKPSAVSNIPFVNLRAQYDAYREEIDSAVLSVMEDTGFIAGPEVSSLESELTAYIGSAHAVTCANGTDALYLSLLALGVGAGDEVITTPFTFFATVETILLVGATPVFADVRLDSFNLDPDSIEAQITERTRVILPVSIFGQPADMQKINRVARTHGLHVIEDAAQSFGAEYRDQKSCNLSDLGCTSFFPSKPLGCYGDGGAIFTNDEELAERLRLLRNHGTVGRHLHSCLGTNARLDAMQAAILRVKLPYLDAELDVRRATAAKYDAAFRGVGDIIVPRIAEDRSSSYAQYTIRTKARQALVSYLADRGIPTAIHYPMPAYRQEALVSIAGRDYGRLPVVERACQEVVSLPMCAFLKEEDQEQICAAVVSFFGRDM